jgi:asparagine synthase (glutamine-hydrolysing)
MPIDPQASSEELLLLAWERWDQVCLQRVIGDYSFGLWDAQEECFWCARDFVGPRPFFYANAGGVFSFSNTLDFLREVPEVSGALDEEFLGDFFLGLSARVPFTRNNRGAHRGVA